MPTLTAKEQRRLVSFAKRALHGLDDSGAFVSVAASGDTWDCARIEWLLQIAHCMVTNKPIVVTCPRGHALPPKLAAVADRIVYYDPADLETMKIGLTQALTEIGINRQ